MKPPPLSPPQGAIAAAEDRLAGLRQDYLESMKNAAEKPVIKQEEQTPEVLEQQRLAGSNMAIADGTVSVPSKVRSPKPQNPMWLNLDPRGARCALHTSDTRVTLRYEVLKQRMGATSAPHTNIGVGPPGGLQRNSTPHRDLKVMGKVRLTTEEP